MSYYPIGAILKRDLKDAPGLLYFHMGIYIGDGFVIHFSGMEKKAKKSTIVMESLARFAAGEEVKLHRSPKSSTHGNAIMLRAYKEMKKAERGAGKFHHKYGMVSNNCEDFCIHCYKKAHKKVFSKKESPGLSQTDKTLIGAGVIGALLYAFTNRE